MSELNKHADSGAAENQLRAHSFDGIQEYDNRLPNWWLWTLHGSIVFSLAYWIIFHSLGVGKMPHESFEADRRRRPAARPDSVKMKVLIPTTSPALLTSGPPLLPGLIAASVWIIPR